MLSWVSGLLGFGALGAANLPDLVFHGVHIPVGGMVAAAITVLAHALPSPFASVIGSKV